MPNGTEGFLSRGVPMRPLRNDPFAPGLPVLPEAERQRRVADMQARKPLSDDLRRKLDELANYEFLQKAYPDEGADALIADAKQTLAGGDDLQMAVNMARRNAEPELNHPISAEEMAPRPTTTYRDVADQTIGALGFLPGPVGMAARVGSGLLGAEDMITEGPSLANAFQTGMGALEAFSSIKGLREAARMNPLVTSGKGAAYRVPLESLERSEAMAASRAGKNGIRTAGRAGERSASAQVQYRGDLPTDSTEPMESLRTKIRNIVPEGPADSKFRSAGTTRVAPEMSDDVAAQVGEGMELPGRLQFNRPTPPNLEIQGNVTTPGPNGFGSPSVPTERRVSDLGLPVGVSEERRATDLYRQMKAALDQQEGEGIQAARSVAARVSDPVKRSAPVKRGEMPSLDILREETMSPEHLSALDALAAGDETAMRTVLFGGSGHGAGSGGKFVRPSDRGPVRVKPGYRNRQGRKRK